MKILHSKESTEKLILSFKAQGKSIGLVPTMGALHKGHASLVELALEQNDIVVVSIFVNPTQFDNEEDLKNYPRTLDSDVAFLQKIDPSILVYAPTADDIYDGDISSDSFDFGGLDKEMEGKHRIGHFDGVGSIVKRLFEVIMPDRAYFGEKDYQQLAIVSNLVKNLKLPITIVAGPIYREDDGLAMSSRNKRLKKEYREVAPFIYDTLKTVKSKFGIESVTSLAEWVESRFKSHPLLNLEYFEIADSMTLKPIKEFSKDKKYRAFIAVFADDIRLIDNIALN